MLRKYGMHERTRTADPYRVKVVLYQLSYVPKGKTRSRIDYFGERAKVAKRVIECQASRRQGRDPLDHDRRQRRRATFFFPEAAVVSARSHSSMRIASCASER